MLSLECGRDFGECGWGMGSWWKWRRGEWLGFFEWREELWFEGGRRGGEGTL